MHQRVRISPEGHIAPYLAQGICLDALDGSIESDDDVAVPTQIVTRDGNQHSRRSLGVAEPDTKPMNCSVGRYSAQTSETASGAVILIVDPLLVCIRFLEGLWR